MGYGVDAQRGGQGGPSHIAPYPFPKVDVLKGDGGAGHGRAILEGDEVVLAVALSLFLGLVLGQHRVTEVCAGQIEDGSWIWIWIWVGSSTSGAVS